MLRKLIEGAMDLERRTMQLYCRFETMFPEPAEVRAGRVPRKLHVASDGEDPTARLGV